MSTNPYLATAQTPAAGNLPPKTSSLAIASLVSGIISILGCLFITGIPAIICGHIAKRRIKKSSSKLTGKGLATAGLIMGYLSLLFSLLAAVSISQLIKQEDIMNAVKDSFNAQILHQSFLAYESTHGAYPEKISDLEGYDETADQKWTYFPGQTSASNANNILIASSEYKNGTVFTLKIDGSNQIVSTADYQAIAAAQSADTTIE